MSDMISGVAGQILQQLIEKQNVAQPTPQTGGRSFDSYLQQDGAKTTPTDPKIQTPTVETPTQPTTSGANMQKTLDELSNNLNQRYGDLNQRPADFSKLMPELLESKSRLGLVKAAYSEAGATSKVTNNLSGRFIQVENEFKAVEAIMHSDKNLSTGELLALQARLYQVGQHIEVMSKVVDQMAGGIKTVLNTNV